MLFNLYDIHATSVFGYKSELNPVVRKLIALWGPMWGAAVGTGTLTLLWIAGCTAFKLPLLLAFYAGSRFTLSLLQYRVFRAIGRY